MSQGTKPAHKWIPDRRTSHPSIPPLCFYGSYMHAECAERISCIPCGKSPGTPMISPPAMSMLVGRVRIRPRTVRRQLGYSPRLRRPTRIPCPSATPLLPHPCSPSKPPPVPSLYHLAYILPPPTYGIAMPIRRPCQTTPSIRARHRLTGILHRRLTLERERDDRIP